MTQHASPETVSPFVYFVVILNTRPQITRTIIHTEIHAITDYAPLYHTSIFFVPIYKDRNRAEINIAGGQIFIIILNIFINPSRGCNFQNDFNCDKTCPIDQGTLLTS